MFESSTEQQSIFRPFTDEEAIQQLAHPLGRDALLNPGRDFGVNPANGHSPQLDRFWKRGVVPWRLGIHAVVDR